MKKPQLQRPAAEILHADELKRLEKLDKNAPRPGGMETNTPIGT